MDDLSQQLNQILSDPQSMQQIQGMMSALGLGNNTSSGSTSPAAPPPEPPPAEPGFDPSALAGMLSALGGGSGSSVPAPPPQNPLGGVTPELLQTVTRLAPLLSQVNREDDSTRLLHALRPLLSEKRRKKLDEAIKILQMMRLMPLLKDSGLFSGLLSGLL